ncbi:MAG: hypothetical protein ACXV8H_07400 [Chthoniobacterales bacterium]
MAPKALAQIFSYLGAVLALLAIGAWVDNRDGPNIFHCVRFDERMTIDAYFAIFAISVLLFIVALTLARYAGQQSDGWLNRIPVVRFSAANGRLVSSLTAIAHRCAVCPQDLACPRGRKGRCICLTGGHPDGASLANPGGPREATPTARQLRGPVRSSPTRAIDNYRGATFSF